MAACTGLTCRKRARSEPDDCSDCVPISKRINNLHIRHSTESWDEVEQQAGESFNNNLPGEAGCCQLSPQTSPLVPQYPASHRTAQIPGLPLEIMHNFTVPDINHNNPLLSPLPRQPCPTNTLPPPCQGCYHGYQPGVGLRENDNPYYLHINARLHQAHVDRLHRVGHYDPNS